MSWIAIVPVKGTRDAKSRLDPIRARTRLALAFALDTVAALRAATEVRDVFVITGDHGIGHAFSALGASVLHDLGAWCAGSRHPAHVDAKFFIQIGVIRTFAFEPPLDIFLGRPNPFTRKKAAGKQERRP
ncbi:hypothetical protein E3T54_09725 [Cryobacterium sp. Sr8]|uniref:hypothetical protein n=1 Tax=Cryobacterium sp. Sr8 TaxID=1259203 RepID=UPI00106CA5DF|nr:hypothetical protein [Cryobacterium sp. Sr8]TFD76824.1 hypothetical protein E3T54_09725 [Cryobacterium sp. Sr8]